MKNLILISAILMFLLVSCHKWPDDNDAIPTENLVAYYPFNGNANDESGNKNDGTVHGATLTEDRYGKANSAYYFNGINNYIQVNNSESLNIVGPITICVWLKTGISYGYGTALVNKMQHTPTLRNGYTVYLGYDSLTFGMNIVYDWLTYGGGYCNTNKMVNDNKWHFCVGVYDRQNVKVYVDGELSNSKAWNQDMASTEESLLIGNDPSPDRLLIQLMAPEIVRYYKGSLDDIRIYKCALTDKEIEKLYKGCGNH